MELHVFYEIFTEKSGPDAFSRALISPVYTVAVYTGEACRRPQAVGNIVRIRAIHGPYLPDIPKRLSQRQKSRHSVLHNWFHHLCENENAFW